MSPGYRVYGIVLQHLSQYTFHFPEDSRGQKIWASVFLVLSSKPILTSTLWSYRADIRNMVRRKFTVAIDEVFILEYQGMYHCWAFPGRIQHLVPCRFQRVRLGFGYIKVRSVRSLVIYIFFSLANHGNRTTLVSRQIRSNCIVKLTGCRCRVIFRYVSDEASTARVPGTIISRLIPRYCRRWPFL